jgi:phospholipid/cholesterol/gamma-HCH transport system substrate-binding protein
VAGINEVVEKFKEIDPKAISDQLLATTKALEEFIKSKQIASMLTRLDAAAGNLERLTARADQALEGHSLEKILADARETLSGARNLVTSVNNQVTAMNLPATLGNAQDITRNLQATTNTLRQSSETLEMLLQRIYERPSDLLFGKPPKKRWNE